jgi:hypothetical protein
MAAVFAECRKQTVTKKVRLTMPTLLRHRKLTIVVLAEGERLIDFAKPLQIVIVPEHDKWWTHFVASDGSVDSYDVPFPTYNQALWAAKAAAEFGLE